MSKPIAVLLAVFVGLLALVWILRDPPANTPAELEESLRANSARAAQSVGVEPPASVAESAASTRSEVAPAAPVLEECTGVLIMRCRDAQTAEALQGVRLQLRHTKTDDKDGSVRIETAPPAVTDGEGRCEITLPCERALSLSAISPRKSHIGVSQQLAPLQRGERRELLLELSADPTIAMYVRIVDRASGAAIADATIERSAEEGEPLTSDADGLCSLEFRLSTARKLEFEIPKRLPAGFCRVSAAGYGPAEFQECEGHESADKALELALERAASLSVALLHRPDSSAGALEVRATLQAFELVRNAVDLGTIDMQTLEFKAPCDAAGNALLEGLPPDVPLKLRVYQGPELVRAPAEALRLEPGERRVLEIDLGSACRLSGSVVDSGGAAVAGLELWLAPKGQYPSARFNSWEEKEVVSKTRSDASGRFDLGEVPAGRYRLGPAGRNPDPRATGVEASVATLNLEVVIGPDERSKGVLLRVDRGLYVRGFVLRPDGTPLSGRGQVRAGTRLGYSQSCFTQEDGSFTVGPLVAGRYSVQANGGDGFAESPEVEADAGAQGVALTLREGAELSGRVVESAGGPGVRATLIFSSLDGSGRVSQWISDERGGFRRTSLVPNRYALFARTADGRFAKLHSFSLAPGEKRLDQELLLAPGARLRVRFDGVGTPLWFKATENGASFCELEAPRNGEFGVMPVPAGELRLQLRLEGLDTPLEQTLHVSAGEERVVVFSQN